MKVLGTILRFHGADHSPWLFDNVTQAVIRQYLEMRYALAPSLVAAGRVTQRQGTFFLKKEKTNRRPHDNIFYLSLCPSGIQYVLSGFFAYDYEIYGMLTIVSALKFNMTRQGSRLLLVATFSGQ